MPVQSVVVGTVAVTLEKTSEFCGGGGSRRANRARDKLLAGDKKLFIAVVVD